MAVAIWLLLSPVTEWSASGRLPALILNNRSSNAGLVAMWRVQLPGTGLAAALFSLVLIQATRAGLPKWSTSAGVGAALAGSASLIIFASPLPGLPVLVWGLTLYATGLPIVWLLEQLPGVYRAAIPFSTLVAVWSVVVVWALTGLAVLLGSVAAEVAWEAVMRGRRTTGCS
jgi:hypothetical protein